MADQSLLSSSAASQWRRGMSDEPLTVHELRDLEFWVNQHRLYAERHLDSHSYQQINHLCARLMHLRLNRQEAHHDAR